MTLEEIIADLRQKNKAPMEPTIQVVYKKHKSLFDNIEKLINPDNDLDCSYIENEGTNEYVLMYLVGTIRNIEWYNLITKYDYRHYEAELKMVEKSKKYFSCESAFPLHKNDSIKDIEYFLKDHEHQKEILTLIKTHFDITVLKEVKFNSGLKTFLLLKKIFSKHN